MAGTKTHVVKKGESLSKIAKKYGWPSGKDLYNAKENADLRKARPDMNKIEPGDKVIIPEPPVDKSTKLQYRKDMPRMSIDIDGKKKLIFVQQKWQYDWKVKSGCSAWTSAQKKIFHNDCDKAIWAKWSGKYQVACSGTSDFAKAMKGQTFNVSFDIKYVSSGGHWTVTVTKIPKGSKKTSSVKWGAQTIDLDTEDVKKRKDIDQVPVAHEFGHAVGNSIHGPAGHGDEYHDDGVHFDDKDSMMNVGSELRKRHADHLIGELNKMIKDTTFEVKAIK
ncbi:MAG: LysM peptidoglycan-binding domain-containing protein [Pseudomonadota bacterium]